MNFFILNTLEVYFVALLSNFNGDKLTGLGGHASNGKQSYKVIYTSKALEIQNQKFRVPDVPLRKLSGHLKTLNLSHIITYST